MSKVLPCAIIAAVITYLVHNVLNSSWVAFIVNAVVFVLIYGLLLILWGLNKEEKRIVFGRFVSGGR